MATNRNSEHLRYRYGICLNDNCQKCKNKEVQQIAARKDFVCEECGKPLRECPPPKKGPNKIVIFGIVAALFIAVVAAGAYFFMSGGDDSTPANLPLADTTSLASKDETLATDSARNSADSAQASVPVDAPNTTQQPTTVVEKTVVVEKPVVVEKTVVVEKNSGAASASQNTTSGAGPKVSFGTYSGPSNGIGGEISVTRAYTLDLRKGDGSALSLQPGDKIRNTRFQNGELKQGVWVHNGETQFFSR